MLKSRLWTLLLVALVLEQADGAKDAPAELARSPHQRSLNTCKPCKCPTAEPHIAMLAEMDPMAFGESMFMGVLHILKPAINTVAGIINEAFAYADSIKPGSVIHRLTFKGIGANIDAMSNLLNFGIIGADTNAVKRTNDLEYIGNQMDRLAKIRGFQGVGMDMDKLYNSSLLFEVIGAILDNFGIVTSNGILLDAPIEAYTKNKGTYLDVVKYLLNKAILNDEQQLKEGKRRMEEAKAKRVYEMPKMMFEVARIVRPPKLPFVPLPMPVDVTTPATSLANLLLYLATSKSKDNLGDELHKSLHQMRMFPGKN